MIDGREKIIVIEGDEASRERLRAAIEGAGYLVTLFAAAQEGLEAARQPGTDVLVLDASAAGAETSGARQVIAAMRGSAQTESVRVILLTGATAEARTTALDLGADD